MVRLYAAIDTSIIKRVFGDVNRRENNKRKAVTDESRLLQPFFEKELLLFAILKTILISDFFHIGYGIKFY